MNKFKVFCDENIGYMLWGNDKCIFGYQIRGDGDLRVAKHSRNIYIRAGIVIDSLVY